MTPLIFAVGDSAPIARRIAEEMSTDVGRLFSKSFLPWGLAVNHGDVAGVAKVLPCQRPRPYRHPAPAE